MAMHTEGPGLKVLSTRKWWGGCYCGICGHTCDRCPLDPWGGERCASPLLPEQVRWWDPDDGWRVGVLCRGCGEDAAERGPRQGDFGLRFHPGLQAEKIDIVASFGDEDSTYSEFSDE